MYQAVGTPGSRLTRVTWMLEELGEPYEIVRAKQHSETMRRYNPTGKMPALSRPLSAASYASRRTAASLWLMLEDARRRSSRCIR